MCGGEQHASIHSPLEMDDDEEMELQDDDESPFDSAPASPDLDGSGSSTPNPIPIRARQSPSFNYHELQKLKAVSLGPSSRAQEILLTWRGHVRSKMVSSFLTTGRDTTPSLDHSSPKVRCDSPEVCQGPWCCRKPLYPRRQTGMQSDTRRGAALAISTCSKNVESGTS